MPLQPHKVLTMDEIQTCLKDLHRRKGKGRLNAFINLIVFRLSCCVGLRCMEIHGLNLGDIQGGTHPLVVVRRDNTKGGKNKRIVPLDLDQGCLSDVIEWLTLRKMNGATEMDPMVTDYHMEQRLSKRTLFDRWKTAIRCLGPDRVAQLSIHAGRHSFGTHALRAGYSLAEVRDWMGHSSIATTDKYTHALRTDVGKDMFG